MYGKVVVSKLRFHRQIEVRAVSTQPKKKGNTYISHAFGAEIKRWFTEKNFPVTEEWRSALLGSCSALVSPSSGTSRCETWWKTLRNSEISTAEFFAECSILLENRMLRTQRCDCLPENFSEAADFTREIENQYFIWIWIKYGKTLSG